MVNGKFEPSNILGNSGKQNEIMANTLNFPKGRLLSLDVYRGLTMFLLMAEAAFVYQAFTDYFSPDSIGGHIIHQFHHHPWNVSYKKDLN